MTAIMIFTLTLKSGENGSSTLHPCSQQLFDSLLHSNRRVVKSWLWALNEAVEISEYILHSHLLEHGITILGVVEPLRLPLEFGSLRF